jgi:putative membrane protein
MGFVSMALAAAIVAGGCNDGRDAAQPSSETVGTTGENDRVKVSGTDKDFINDLVVANMAEVELGRLATERAAHAEVKKFGQMMIDDHTKAGNTLEALASKHSIAVPAAVDEKHRDLRDRFATLQGADFDRAYMDAMVSGHEDVLDKLGSRVDKTTLSEWKAEQADSVNGKKVEARAKAVTVRPEKSDNVVTTAINQWAADSHPVVAAHLTAAKALQTAVKRPMTN